MSLSQPERGANGGQPVASYDPDGNAPAQLWIGGYPDDDGAVRVPLIDDGVTLHERTDGPTDIARMAEVTIPASAYDTDWSAFMRRNQMEPATLVMNDETVDQSIVALHGYVAAIGGGSKNTETCRIGGPSQFLTEIGASASFTRSTRLREILTYLKNAFEDGQPVFDSVEIDVRDTIGLEPSVLEIFGTNLDTRKDKGADSANVGFVNRTYARKSSYNRKEHTLGDVFTDLLQDFVATLTIQPAPDSDADLTIVIQPDPNGYTALAEHLGGDLRVYENDALAEIAPINQVRVEGIAGRKLQTPIGNTNVTFGDNEYPYVVVQYPSLVDRADAVFEATTTVSLTNVLPITQRAERILDERVTSRSDGPVVTALTPTLHPRSGIKSRPRLTDAVIDADPIAYEIREARHKAYANENGVHAESRFDVALYTDALDIEVVEVGSETVAGGN